jgi:hypothetical protein
MPTEHDHLTTLIELMAQAESETELEAYRWLGTRSRRPLHHSKKPWMWWLGEGHPRTETWITRKGNPFMPGKKHQWQVATLPGPLFRRLKPMPGVSGRTGEADTKQYELRFKGGYLREAYRSVALAWYRSPRHRLMLDAWVPPDARRCLEATA